MVSSVFYVPIRGLSVLFDFEKFASKLQGNSIPFHFIHLQIKKCASMNSHNFPNVAYCGDLSTFNQTANRPMNGSQKFVQKYIMVIKILSIQLKYK